MPREVYLHRQQGVVRAKVDALGRVSYKFPFGGPSEMEKRDPRTVFPDLTDRTYEEFVSAALRLWAPVLSPEEAEGIRRGETYLVFEKNPEGLLSPVVPEAGLKVFEVSLGLTEFLIYADEEGNLLNPWEYDEETGVLTLYPYVPFHLRKGHSGVPFPATPVLKLKVPFPPRKVYPILHWANLQDQQDQKVKAVKTTDKVNVNGVVVERDFFKVPGKVVRRGDHWEWEIREAGKKTAVFRLEGPFFHLPLLPNYLKQPKPEVIARRGVLSLFTPTEFAKWHGHFPSKNNLVLKVSGRDYNMFFVVKEVLFRRAKIPPKT